MLFSPSFPGTGEWRLRERMVELKSTTAGHFVYDVDDIDDMKRPVD